MKYRKGENTVVVPHHKELKPGMVLNILKDIAQQNSISVGSLKSDYSIKL